MLKCNAEMIVFIDKKFILFLFVKGNNIICSLTFLLTNENL